MRNTSSTFLCVISILLLTMPGQYGQAQERCLPKQDAAGEFEITVKGDPKKTIIVDELVLDRDLDNSLKGPTTKEKAERHLYRVESGGYLSFRESEWVDKIDFKAHAKPVTEMPFYKEHSEVLTEITTTIWQIKEALGLHDQYGLRSINVCGQPRLGSLGVLDDDIHEQLKIFSSLEKLRQDVLVSLNTLIESKSCTDLFKEYEKCRQQSLHQLNEIYEKFRALDKKFQKLNRESRDRAAQSHTSGRSGSQMSEPSQRLDPADYAQPN